MSPTSASRDSNLGRCGTRGTKVFIARLISEQNGDKKSPGRVSLSDNADLPPSTYIFIYTVYIGKR